MTTRAKRYQNSAALLIFMRRTFPVEPFEPSEPFEPAKTKNAPAFARAFLMAYTLLSLEIFHAGFEEWLVGITGDVLCDI